MYNLVIISKKMHKFSLNNRASEKMEININTTISPTAQRRDICR